MHILQKILKYKKNIYSEILKYTTERKLFDHVVAELQRLNETIELEKQYTISRDAIPFISNIDLLPKNDKGEFDFYAIIITDFRFLNSNCLSLTIRHDCYYSSNNKEITLEIIGVYGTIELTDIFREPSFGLKIVRNFNALQIEMASLTKGFTILNIEAESVKVVKCECFDNNIIPFCE